MDLITLERVRQFAPGCPLARAEIIGGVLAAECEDYGVSTPLRLHHFLAQIAHESAGFRRLEENLSYSAERLMQVWPRRFPTKADAQVCAGRPFALAEKAYGNRLGNVRPGDGWKYRGRGLIQLTGRENYAEAAKWSGLPLEDNPGLAAEPDDAARIALAFWRTNGLNLIADQDDIAAVTRVINGGTHGLEDRAAWLAKARKVFR